MRETSLTSNLSPSHDRLLQEWSIIVYCGDHTEHILTWCGQNKSYGIFKASNSCTYHCAVKQRLSAIFHHNTRFTAPLSDSSKCSSAVYESPNSSVQKTDYGVGIYNVRKCALYEVETSLFWRLVASGDCNLAKRPIFSGYGLRNRVRCVWTL